MRTLTLLALFVTLATLVNGYGYVPRPKCRVSVKTRNPAVGSVVTINCHCDRRPGMYFIYGPNGKWTSFKKNKPLSFVMRENLYGTYTCWNKYQGIVFQGGTSNHYARVTLRRPADKPTVRIEIDPNPVIERDTITVRAIVDTRSRPLIQEYLFISPSGAHIAAPRGQDFIRVVGVTIVEHKGPWRVKVTGRFGEVLSVPVDLRVLPRAPVVNLIISPNVVTQGRTVTLRAYTNDDGARIERYVFRRGTFSMEALPGDTSVTIINVSPVIHAGKWVVTAYGMFGQVDSRPQELVVKLRPPVVSLIIQPSPVNEGSSFTLRATIDRPARVENYVFFIRSVRYVARPGRNFVVVDTARPDIHSGEWVVRAEGEFGRVESRPLRLVVVSRPMAILTISPNPANEGFPVTFRGSLDQDLPVDKYIFVKATGGIRLTATPGLSSVVLPDVTQREHEGLWRVIVEIGAMTVESRAVMLRVVPRPSPPRVYLVAEPNPAIEGTAVRITAVISGGGAWTKIVFRHGSTELTATNPTNYVEIFDIQITYAGRWQAVVFGLFGEVVTEPINLIIYRRAFTVQIGCDARQYVYNANPMTQKQADRYCHEQGMSLAVPGDEQELSDLQYKIFHNDMVDAYWTGFEKRGNVWTDTVCGSACYWRNIGGSDRCATARGTTILAEDCNERRPFVCQKAKCDVLYTTKYMDRHYVAFTRKRKQPQAIKFCQQLGGKLLTIDEMNEMEAICRPLINMEMINIPFWTSPYAHAGAGINEYTDACTKAIPEGIMNEAFNGTEYGNMASERCTILLEDAYFVRPCDHCNGFICEMPGC